MTVSLTKSLSYCGVSGTAWYHAGRPRDPAIDGRTESLIMGAARTGPACGTRRMAAQPAGRLGAPANRKKVSGICRKPGRTAPGMRESGTIRSGRRLPRPVEPNRFWEAGMSCMWCGRDGRCYTFNVLGAFTGQWLGFAFDARATRRAAIMPVTNAVAARSPDPGRLTIRVDSGSRHAGRDFGRSVDVPGAGPEYACASTPRQNGHTGSLHKTPKKECAWPHWFRDAKAAEVALLGAPGGCNRHRIRSAMGYATPDEFAKRREKASPQEAAGRQRGQGV